MKGLVLFVMGAAASLILGFHVPPITESIFKLWFLFVAMVALWIALSVPEIRSRWWLYRQKTPTTYYATVEKLLGLDVMLVRDAGGGLMEVHSRRNDPSRPPVNKGDSILVTGKTSWRMKDGHNKLVDCQIRLRKDTE